MFRWMTISGAIVFIADEIRDRIRRQHSRQQRRRRRRARRRRTLRQLRPRRLRQPLRLDRRERLSVLSHELTYLAESSDRECRMMRRSELVANSESSTCRERRRSHASTIQRRLRKRHGVNRDQSHGLSRVLNHANHRANRDRHLGPHHDQSPDLSRGQNHDRSRVPSRRHSGAIHRRRGTIHLRVSSRLKLKPLDPAKSSVLRNTKRHKRHIKELSFMCSFVPYVYLIIRGSLRTVPSISDSVSPICVAPIR